MVEGGVGGLKDGGGRRRPGGDGGEGWGKEGIGGKGGEGIGDGSEEAGSGKQGGVREIDAAIGSSEEELEEGTGGVVGGGEGGRR